MLTALSFCCPTGLGVAAHNLRLFSAAKSSRKKHRDILSMAPQTVDHGLLAKILLGPMVCINIGSHLRLLEVYIKSEDLDSLPNHRCREISYDMTRVGRCCSVAIARWSIII